jgi:hypothetical protein
MRTDTITPAATYNAYSCIMQGAAGDEDQTSDWMNTTGAITLALTARSALTDSVLLHLDSLSFNWVNLAGREDTIAAMLGDLRDSTMYFQFDLDTLHMGNCSIAGSLVIQEEGPTIAEESFAKLAVKHMPRAPAHTEFVNPIFLEVHPLPVQPSKNPQEIISFTVPESSGDGNVRIRILDLLGNVVENVLDDLRAAGRYHTAFDCARLSSRMYLAEVKMSHDQQCALLVVTK